MSWEDRGSRSGCWKGVRCVLGTHIILTIQFNYPEHAYARVVGARAQRVLHASLSLRCRLLRICCLLKVSVGVFLSCIAVTRSFSSLPPCTDEAELAGKRLKTLLALNSVFTSFSAGRIRHF